MEQFAIFMTLIIEFMKTPVNLWGYETSFWSIMLFVMISGIVAAFISGIFER